MNDEGGSLPWLEPVANEDGREGPSAGKMLAVLALVIASVVLVVGTLFFVGRSGGSGGAGGEPELIRAPAAPYKVRPDDPGGLDVAAEGDTAYQTSSGEDRDGQLDVRKLDEEQQAALADAKQQAELARAKKEAEARGEAAPKPGAAPKPAAPAATPPAEAVAGAAVLQIGAYANQSQADVAWSLLQKRVPALAGVAKSTSAATVGGKQYVRLRASGSPSAIATACTALKAAGENCLRVK